ncbi:MAG: beta strand repeat-containing protein, partial [Candidatus Eiseniibacteriota bacterium]
LHSTSLALNSAGTPLGSVLDDIDGQVRSLTTPDIGADEFTPISALSGTHVIGTGGDYPTFAAAATDLIARGVSGPVTFQAVTGTYTESLVLSAIPGASSTNRVTFMAQSGFPGNVALQNASLLGTGLDSPIELNSAQYVTFNAMTIQSSSSVGTGSSALVWIAGTTSNISFTNCVFNTVGSGRVALHPVNATVDQLQAVNCQFILPAGGSTAIQASGTGAFTNFLLQGSTITSSAGLANTGLFSSVSTTGLQVLGNTFSFGGLGVGINLTGAAQAGAVIRANRITGVATGLTISGLGSGSLIANNVVSAGTAPVTITGPTSVTLAYNSLLALSTTSALTINAATAGAVALRNNVIACAAGAVPVVASTANAIANPDYNDYYTTGPVIETLAGVNYATVAALRTATGFEVHGISANPGFVASTDLHSQAPAINGAGTPLGTVLDDVDGEVRSLTTPDMGADEFSTSLTPMAGTYTVGASGTYANPAAAAADVSLRGVSAPVSFLIQSGTYSGTTLLTPATGANAVNRVRFVAQSGVASDVVLQAPGVLSTGADAVLRLEGARYVDFDSLTIQPSAPATGSNCGLVWMLYGAMVDRFQGCKINVNNGNAAGIRSVTATVDSLEVSGCEFVCPASAGNAYAVLLNGVGTANGAVFSSNSVTIGVQSQAGFYTTTPGTGLAILNNTFTMAGGIAINLLATSSSAAVIRGNKIIGSGTGISGSNVGGATLIANNMIQASNAPVTLTNPGVMTIAFNSLLATGATVPLTLGGGTPGGVTLRNNIFAAAGGAQGYTAPANLIGSADYDDYFTAGASLAFIGSTNYANLSTLQVATGFETHGVVANPGFVSNSDLHALAPALNNAGTPVTGVLDDIDGEVRSLSTPDIGADEFSTSLTPMAGIYTVGASGTYATPIAAVADLTIRGISAPVSFLIESGTYNGTAVLTPVTGANSLTRVRFVAQSGNASDVVFQSAGTAADGSDAELLFQGARYFDVDSLTLTSLPGGASLGASATLQFAATFNRFQGCRFNVQPSNGDGLRCPSGTADSLQVIGCQFNITGSNGVGVQFNGSGPHIGLAVLNNTFTCTSASTYAIYDAANSTGDLIQGNTFLMSGGTGTGIAATATGLVYRNNKILASTTGLNFNAVGSGSLIANNMVQATGTALLIQSPGGITVAFNSFQSTGTSVVVQINGGTAGSVSFKNNVLAGTGGAALLQYQAGIITAADYDDYYTPGQLMISVSAVPYNSLTAFQSATGLESHAISANPGFVSGTDLHSRAPALLHAGTPFASVLDDFDGDVRSLSAPSIGADEFTSSLTPLAGTYTVGASGVYPDPASAAADISLRGLSAPVSFLIQSGTYTGTVLLTPVSGANVLNHVRFVSQSGVPGDVMIQAAAQAADGSDAAVRLDGGRYMDFDSLTIKASNALSGAPGALVWMTNNCTGSGFQGSTLTTVGSNRLGMRAAGAVVDSMQINNCQITIAGAAPYGIEITVPGIANGMMFSGNTFSVPVGNVTVIFMNVSSTGLVVQNQVMTLPNNGTGLLFQPTAMSLTTIRGNRIVGASGGMSLSSMQSGLIANNMIQASGVG